MNCKPGDLAVVIKTEDTEKAGTVDKVVRVQSHFRIQGVDYWKLAQAVKGRGSLMFEGLADHILRPIRDPGDDAVDETLQWLPAPTIHSQIKEDKSQEVAHG